MGEEEHQVNVELDVQMGLMVVVKAAQKINKIEGDVKNNNMTTCGNSVG